MGGYLFGLILLRPRQDGRKVSVLIRRATLCLANMPGAPQSAWHVYLRRAQRPGNQRASVPGINAKSNSPVRFGSVDCTAPHADAGRTR